MALYRAGLRNSDRVAQLLHAPTARYSAGRSLGQRYRGAGLRLLGVSQQPAACCDSQAKHTLSCDGAQASTNDTLPAWAGRRHVRRGSHALGGAALAPRVHGLAAQPRHRVGGFGRRAFSAAAGTSSGVDALDGDGAAGAVASTASAGSGAAIDEGVSYPLWFLDPEGSVYQTIMAANDATATALTAVHDTLGLPWWGTIVAATLLIRVAMLPLNVYAVRNTSRCAPPHDSRAHAHVRLACALSSPTCVSVFASHRLQDCGRGCGAGAAAQGVPVRGVCAGSIVAAHGEVPFAAPVRLWPERACRTRCCCR